MAHPRLALSFIEQKPFSITKWSWLGVMILIIGAVLLAYVLYIYQNTEQVLEKLNSEISLVSLKLARTQVKNFTNVTINSDEKLSQVEVKQINETVKELTVNWGQLFGTIEQTLIKDVALMEISPNSKSKAITIRGEAKNLNKIFEYIKTLDETPIFTKVHLDTHSVGEENLGRPVSFTLTAEWQTSD